MNNSFSDYFLNLLVRIKITDGGYFMRRIKSCINYTGGKYRLLKQILPLFPSKIDTFVDLLCGGANVALNVNANNIYCYDNNESLIQLFNYIKSNDFTYLLNSINSIIENYKLSNTDKYGYKHYNCDSSSGLAKFNKPNYLKLREDFNNDNLDKEFDKCLYFYTLILFGFNNQIRFNKQNKFNNPVGKRDFNKKSQKNLKDFHSTVNRKNISFECADFRNVDLNNLTEKDFVYLDPPYLITTASYNEQGGWSNKDEKDLLNLMDKLNDNNVKFALSNVLESKRKSNDILKEWSKDYNVNYLNFNYDNSNYQVKDKTKAVEVLICNY